MDQKIRFRLDRFGPRIQHTVWYYYVCMSCIIMYACVLFLRALVKQYKYRLRFRGYHYDPSDSKTCSQTLRVVSLVCREHCRLQIGFPRGCLDELKPLVTTRIITPRHVHEPALTHVITAQRHVHAACWRVADRFQLLAGPFEFDRSVAVA